MTHTYRMSIKLHVFILCTTNYSTFFSWYILHNHCSMIVYHVWMEFSETSPVGIKHTGNHTQILGFSLHIELELSGFGVVCWGLHYNPFYWDSSYPYISFLILHLLSDIPQQIYICISCFPHSTHIFYLNCSSINTIISCHRGGEPFLISW